MKKVLFGCLVLALAAAAPAFAQTETGDVTVSATVAQACSISSGSLDFGAYNPLSGTDLDVDGEVLVTCSTNDTVHIGLGLGANASGSTRRMNAGSAYLPYELFKDGTRLLAWGNADPDWLAHTPSGISEASIPIYGRIQAGQFTSAGSFADTVVATVNF
jgi:spore coat protein U-like protein